jgi:hypothetical protein
LGTSKVDIAIKSNACGYRVALFSYLLVLDLMTCENQEFRLVSSFTLILPATGHVSKNISASLPPRKDAHCNGDSFVPSSPQTAMRRNESREMERDLYIREKQMQQKQKMSQRSHWSHCSQRQLLKFNQQQEITIRN